MKPDDEMRKLDRDHGFRVYKVRHSTRRVLFEIALIIFGFIATISIIKAFISSLH